MTTSRYEVPLPVHASNNQSLGLRNWVRDFLKIGFRICGTRLGIRVSGDWVGVNFFYHRWVKFFKSLLDVDTWQSTSELNSQRPIEASETNIAGFYKTGGPNL